jgi:citrate synthase
VSALVEATLNEWAAGRAVREIAESIGRNRNVVLGIVHRARQRRDPRALRRAPPNAAQQTPIKRRHDWIGVVVRAVPIFPPCSSAPVEHVAVSLPWLPCIDGPLA